MKETLEQLVKEVVNKDTLYEPMKAMREQYPLWLEENWDKVPAEELERYNRQLDKVIEICEHYEQNSEEGNPRALELLGELQELGSPPEALLKIIAGK